MATTPKNVHRFAKIHAGAAYLDCSDGTIRNLIARGDIQAYRVGRVIRVDLNEIDDYVSGR